MAITTIAIGKQLGQFVDEYIGDQHCLLELLRFLGRHPLTRFSRLAIIHALDAGRPQTERALNYLVGNGVVRVTVENGLPVYTLTEKDSLSHQVLELAGLNWNEWKSLLEEAQ